MKCGGTYVFVVIGKIFSSEFFLLDVSSKLHIWDLIMKVTVVLYIMWNYMKQFVLRWIFKFIPIQAQTVYQKSKVQLIIGHRIDEFDKPAVEYLNYQDLHIFQDTKV